jgi:hypothetical protein
MQARHVGGDRSRNGLPESCAGYVYRGSTHVVEELQQGKIRPRCQGCGSFAGADGLCSGCRELKQREQAAYERLARSRA